MRQKYNTKVQHKGATHNSKIKTKIQDNGARYIIDIGVEGARQREPKRKTKVQDKEEYKHQQCKIRVQEKGARQGFKTTEQDIGLGTRQKRGKRKAQDSGARQMSSHKIQRCMTQCITYEQQPNF